MTEDATGEGGAGRMRKRRTTLVDGRYLIYYTFGDGGDARPADAGASGREPSAEPESEEERRV